MRRVRSTGLDPHVMIATMRAMTSLNRLDTESLNGLLSVLSRAAGCHSSDIDAAELEAELLGLIHAIGLADDGTEHGQAWLEIAHDKPSHAELAKACEQAATTDNPLSADALHDDLRPALNAKIRRAWSGPWRRQRRNAEPSLRAAEWELLDDDARREIREMLLALGRHHRSFVRRGRVQKIGLDTALAGLAELFLRYSGSQLGTHQVPYSVNSQFIQFAVLALKPVGAHFEISPQALSRRWERCVRHMRMADDDDPEASG